MQDDYVYLIEEREKLNKKMMEERKELMEKAYILMRVLGVDTTLWNDFYINAMYEQYLKEGGNNE